MPLRNKWHDPQPFFLGYHFSSHLDLPKNWGISHALKVTLSGERWTCHGHLLTQGVFQCPPFQACCGGVVTSIMSCGKPELQ